MISSAISSEIGGFLTFVELILSILLGMTILRTFQFSLMEKINEVKNGLLTQDEFIKSSIGKAIGAVLLIMPGFFTDILGLLLQFGMFTLVFSKIFKFKPKVSNNTYYSQQTYNYTKGDEDVIDVEVIDDDKHIKH